MSQEHALIVISPVLEVQTVVVHVDQGTLWCTPNGGALRVPPRSLVRWQCDYPFSISFRQLGGAHAPWPPLQSHPEAGGIEAIEVKPPPPLPKDAPEPFYEYSVRVGNLTLDPIIIVDKT